MVKIMKDDEIRVELTYNPTVDREDPSFLIENKRFQHILDMDLPEDLSDLKFKNEKEKQYFLASYYKWCPDIFLDVMTAENGRHLNLYQRVLLRVLFRFKYVYTTIPRGSAKCVSQDTILYTDEGMKEIGEYTDYSTREDEYFIPNNITAKNRYGEMETSNAYIHNGKQEVNHIVTEDGYEVKCTNIHPLLTINNKGQFEWKKSEDLTCNDYLLISRKNDIWGKDTDIKVNFDEFEKSLEGNPNKNRVLKCKPKIPNTLNEDIALIMGYLLGDGCLTRRNEVLLSNIDEDIINNYIRIMESEFNVEIKKRENKCDYVIYGIYFRELLNQLGLGYGDSYNKRIPRTILNAPKNIVAKCIQGMYDTDGTIGKNTLSYTTASSEMARQLQIILLNFGIISHKVKKYNKRFKTYHYKVNIYSDDIIKFKNEVGFSCSRKQAILDDYCKNKKRTNSNKDIIPNCKDIVSEYVKSINKSNIKSYLTDRTYHVRKGNCNLTYQCLKELINIDNNESYDNYETLKEIYDCNYYFSKISIIEKDECIVCDVSMPKTHSFVGNGIINHNSFIQVLAYMLMAVMYPTIKLSILAETKQQSSSILRDKSIVPLYRNV